MRASDAGEVAVVRGPDLREKEKSIAIVSLVRAVLAAFASVVALLMFPSAISAQEAPSDPARAESTVSTAVPAGGWVAYRLSFAGEGSPVGLSLAYSPNDDPNDRFVVEGQQVTMAIYGPEAPPPNGTPIGYAKGKGGSKNHTLTSGPAGEYVVILSNWDSLGREVQLTLRSWDANTGTEVENAGPGPGLSLVSSSGDVVASQPTGTTESAVEEASEPAGEDSAQRPAASSAAGLRVGIQAGHWLTAELPDELRRLRTSTGTSGGGVPEWQLNLSVARRVAAILENEGITVDVLPSTIPVGYSADAFVALHADGDVTGRISGFKLAHGRWSGTPVADKALVQTITAEYGALTGLRHDPEHISRNMTGYYAFSNRRFAHAVAPGTPAVIVEMGFMTNRSDLAFLLGSQDVVAEGIARGILRFLNER